MSKRIDTTLHYAQYIIARIIFMGGIGFLIYSIWTQKIGAIVFCSLCLIFAVFLLNKVFDKPTDIVFDENFLYLNNGTERIELNKITSIKKNRILYQSNGIESKVKLPNFHFMDKNWAELKELIHKSTKHNKA